MITVKTGAVAASAVWRLSGGTEAAVVRRVIEKIVSFGRLPRGWHYGVGQPMTKDIIASAKAQVALFALLVFADMDAFPGGEGQIMVTAYQGRHCVETTIEINQTFSVAHQIDGNDVSYEPGLSLSEAILEVLKVKTVIDSESCPTSAWSISNTTTIGSANSGISRSPLLATEPALPLSMNNVELLRLDQSVLISNNFTTELAGSPPYFGNLVKRNWTQLAV